MNEVDWEEVFRDVIRERGLKQWEVAEGIGTTQPTISLFMRNQSLRVKGFLKLMRYLGYEIYKKEELQP